MTAPVRLAGRLTVPFERGADTLPLRLLPAGPSRATVAEYDFAEHRARFGRAPVPRYVLAAGSAVDVDTTVTVTVRSTESGAERTVTVPVPAGTPAGGSVLLAPAPSLTDRLVRLDVTPAAADGHPELHWTLTALLGTTAALLWVLGADRDVLRGYTGRVAAQRQLPSAVGLSLDLIGADLGVPRFPPLPYGFDADTVALYHLDTAVAGTALSDATGAFPGRTGRPGTVVGNVRLGVPGRYGEAVGFEVAGGLVDVPTHPGLDIPATGSASVECFVRPDAGAGDGPVLSRHPAPGGAGSGWVLAVGDFGRGLARNVRFTVSDGTRSADLFADVSLPTDAFSHLAGVIDRAAGRVALYVDGVLRASRSAAGLIAIGAPAPLRMGAAAGGFRGVLDEVRISAVARPAFDPTLGEADEHYRRRLRLFRRWTLPTPANLTARLNELVGPIGGRTDPLVLSDANATLVRGTRLVRIRPATLAAGDTIDAAGRRGVTEAATVGTAAADSFDPAYLVTYDRADVAAVEGRQIAVGVADRLDRLVAAAAAEPGATGRLRLVGAFDPAAADLRATGRAVLVDHGGLPPARLAALAHRAGFDFVRHEPNGRVYAAAGPGDPVSITVAPGAAGAPVDVAVGGTLTLSVRPAPPADAFVRWLVVPGGRGRATLTQTPRGTATVAATAAGELIVKADVTRRGRTVSATRTLRFGLGTLADGGAIAADGTTGPPGAAITAAGPFFHPVFLLRHDDPRVDYGTVADHRRMQPAVGEVLDALLAELARRGTTGQLRVTQAFEATGEPAVVEGRRLVLRHTVLDPGALAAAAFAVGFGHVQRAGADVLVRQPPGQLVAVRGAAAVDRAGVVQVEEGSAVELTASPAPAALAAAGLTGPPAGTDPRLSWATGTFGPARVTVGSTSQPAVRVTAGPPGAAWVQASYLLGADGPPFTFEVRLRPELSGPDTVVSKDQHDLIMNILNVLHPVGVEVLTTVLRQHVVEVRGDQLAGNPDYTYPKFRARGVLPRQARRPSRG